MIKTEYTDYNINIVCFDILYKQKIEKDILNYYLMYNLKPTLNSSDNKSIIAHCIITNILENYIKLPADLKNVLIIEENINFDILCETFKATQTEIYNLFAAIIKKIPIYYIFASKQDNNLLFKIKRILEKSRKFTRFKKFVDQYSLKILKSKFDNIKSSCIHLK